PCAAPDRRRHELAAAPLERRRQQLQAHPTANVTPDREHALARGIDLDDDIAVRAHANAESVPAIGYRPVRRAAHAAREVAGLDRPFADIVCDERRGEVRIVARGDRLIDIRMVRDVPAEPLVAADAALAHHPRDERRGPRVPPARADTGRPLPYR